MVLGERRLGVFFLVILAILSCLLILSTTSSTVQARAEARSGGAVAIAGGDDCVEFEGKAGGTQEALQDENGADQQTQVGNEGDQQVQDQNGNNNVRVLRVQNEVQGDIRQSVRIGSGADQQIQENEGEGTTDQETLQNGADDQEAQQNGEDGTTTPDAQKDGTDECVIANTVPDEPLLPTGAPVKDGAAGTTVEKEKKTDRKSDGGGKLEPRGEEQKKSDRGKKVEIEDRSGKKPRQEKPETRSKAVSAPDLAPMLAATEWTPPSREEVVSTEKPRRFAPNPGAEMTLSVRAMGLYNVSVANSDRLEDLDDGLVRKPETSRPWDKGNQKNVYIAGHYLGLRGTQSRLVFYKLGELKSGDELVLKDGWGRTYKYRVSEKFAVGKEDSWVMGQVRNRDMLTLQTCIPPDFGKRLIVRADRVKDGPR